MTVLLVPQLRTLESAKMHISRHHGHSHAGLTTLKQMIGAHLAMHGKKGGGKINDIFADLPQHRRVVPHIHDDGTDVRVWRPA